MKVGDDIWKRFYIQRKHVANHVFTLLDETNKLAQNPMGTCVGV